MWLYTVSDKPEWWQFEDAADTFEHLYVSRDDVRRNGVLGRVSARKPADGDERPDLEFYAWSRAEFYSHSAFRRFFERHGDVECVMHGSYLHALSHRDPQARRPLRSLFVKEGAVVEIREFQSGHSTYAAVLHVRRWLLLLPLLLCLSLTLCGSGSSPVAFLQGQTSISGATSKPVLTTSCASYSATPDTVWRAGQTRQDMTLLLPATCTVDGKEGSNPILSAPAIAVDLNNNGSFESSEVVFNSEGAYLRAGAELRHIELSKKLDSGEYAARTIWTSVLAEDGKTPAGTATFDWHLTVK